MKMMEREMRIMNMCLNLTRVIKNENIIMSSFKSSRDIQKKRVGQTAVSVNQSSSVIFAYMHENNGADELRNCAANPRRL